MKILSILSRMILSLRMELVLLSLYTCILIIYCVNPYVINPAEFTLYTKYFIPFGFLIWMFVSFRLTLLIVKSIPLKWLQINKIVENPKKIIINQTGLAFILFLISQIIVAAVIAVILVNIFSSGFYLFKLLFELYLIYFGLPFIWAWFIGLSIGIVCAYYSRRKTILLSSALLIWVIMIFSIEYRVVSGSIFIENRWPYIDPIYSLTFLTENTWIKLIYLACSIGVFIAFTKIRRATIGLAVSMIITVLVTFTTYNIQSQSQSDEILMGNDFRLYEEIKDKDHENIIPTDNWKITGLKIDTQSKYPIIIDLTLDNKDDVVRFSINEQFSISHVKSGEKNLAFKQKGNIVEVKPNGVQSMVLYYENNLGTSFYPLMSNAVLLPFEANWYPQNSISNHFTIDSRGTLYANFEAKKCEHVELVALEESYSWQGDHLDCLSIIKGAYEQVELPKTKLFVYQPFLTKKQNYVELQDQLGEVRNELCRLFKNIKDSDYCTSDVRNILIVPKSMSTTALSLYDSTVSNGSYTFYVNPFLDVNYKPVTAHIEELSTFLIPYRFLEGEKLIYFMSQYLIEKLGIEPIGYLEWVVEDSSISEEEWVNYTNLTIKEKEKVLIQMAAEMGAED